MGGVTGGAWGVAVGVGVLGVLVVGGGGVGTQGSGGEKF